MNLVTAICLAVTRFFFGWITGGPYEETKASGVKREDQGIRKRAFYLQAGGGALREREESYRDLYENAASAYFSISAYAGSILRCNSAAEQLLGYEGETLPGMNVFDLYADTPFGKGKAREVFRRFKAGKPVKDVELQMKR